MMAQANGSYTTAIDAIGVWMVPLGVAVALLLTFALDVAILVILEVGPADLVVIEVAPSLSKGDMTCLFFSVCYLEAGKKTHPVKHMH